MTVAMSPKCLRVMEGKGGGKKKYRAVTRVVFSNFDRQPATPGALNFEETFLFSHYFHPD